MVFFLEDEPLYRMVIARVLQREAVELVAGGPALEDADRPTYYNSVFVLSHQGEVRGRYDKEYLVPFAEYFPAGIDLLRRDFGETRVFTPGQRTSPRAPSAGLAGVLICNEGMLPEVAGQRVAQGATYLLNPSNDTWISDPGFVRQQFEIVSLRAVEQRRDLVRVSTSGPSAIVDPWGRVLVEAAAGASSAISGEVVEHQARSVYGRVGDLFALLCLAATALSVVRVVVPTIWRRGAAHGHGS
jgi:apolipoprotein N-acyltransferase